MTVNETRLHKLHATVESLLQQADFLRTVQKLRGDLSRSPEPFVWSTVNLRTIDVELPEAIKSCWVFLLKKDVPSGCHRHPNSVQHMIAISGEGQAEVDGVSRAIVPIGCDRHSIEDKWFVIAVDAPHEFFPEGEDMAVVSFHTCEITELEEVDCETGRSRHYQPIDA